jgi:hypothetical protein
MMHSTSYLDEDDYSPSDSEPSLADLLIQRTQQSHFDNKKQDFIPEGVVDELITRKAVLNEVSQLGTGDVERANILNFILCHARKVFAITIYSSIAGENLLRAMTNFYRHKFNDESLPIVDLKQLERLGLSPFRLRLWTNLAIRNFCENQWQFLAPVFSPTQFQYNLEADCILPFTWKNSTVKGGYSSQVTEVEIHPAHRTESILTVR